MVKVAMANFGLCQKKWWYPIPDDWLIHIPKSKQFKQTSFGRVPWKSRNEFRRGDIVIFNEYAERVEDGELITDRYLEICQKDIDEYQASERDLLPVGVVVHPPLAG